MDNNRSSIAISLINNADTILLFTISAYNRNREIGWYFRNRNGCRGSCIAPIDEGISAFYIVCNIMAQCQNFGKKLCRIKVF